MRKWLTVVVAGLLMLGIGVSAQETKWVRGTVTAVGPDSVTVKVKDREMKFGVDGKTNVMARGAGTQAREARQLGKNGPKLADVVKTGESVEVRYSEAGMHASSVRVLPSAVADATSDDEPKTLTMSGTVSGVTGSSITLKGSTGANSTFIVDSQTHVVGTGLGTKARADAAAGTKPVLTEFVGTGDSVIVSYRESGAAKHATEVRVRSKASK